MEYYSAIKENAILLFATTWIEFEVIMLSKISKWRKTDTSLYSHWYIKSKQKTDRQITLPPLTKPHRLVVAKEARGWGVGKMDEWDQKIQTSRYKISNANVI